MTQPPAQPKIYHITHVENLPKILEAGGLWSDAAMIARGGPIASIGMGGIKQRRLALPVKCQAGDVVGDYVPFYFCPRSVMLFMIHKGNDPRLAYKGGQGPIIHLEANFAEAVAWAQANGQRWAFSLSNAGTKYTEFRNDESQLHEINWVAVRANYWGPPEVKEGKQAEFLVREFFPWTLVRRIGVHSPTIHTRVARALGGAAHRPHVEVLPAWYY